jgi:hypothetical protein
MRSNTVVKDEGMPLDEFLKNANEYRKAAEA